MNAQVKTPAKPKAATAKKLKAPASTAKKAAAAAPKKERVARPSVAMHSFQSSYGGPSGPLNARLSRTPIDYGKFNSLSSAPLTDRDRKSLDAIRSTFKQGQFARSNVDAGILRRLGERGYLSHVSGSDVAPDAQFRLTKKAFAPEALAQ